MHCVWLSPSACVCMRVSGYVGVCERYIAPSCDVRDVKTETKEGEGERDRKHKKPRIDLCVLVRGLFFRFLPVHSLALSFSLPPSIVILRVLAYASSSLLLSFLLSLRLSLWRCALVANRNRVRAHAPPCTTFTSAKKETPTKKEHETSENDEEKASERKRTREKGREKREARASETGTTLLSFFHFLRLVVPACFSLTPLASQRPLLH